METTVLVFQLLASIAVIVACGFFIFVLVRLKDLFGGIGDELKLFNEKTTPILENIDYISDRIKNITDNIDDQVMVVQESIGSVREIVDNVVQLERQVQSRIEGPILDTVSVVAAFVKGVKTFFERLRS